MARECASTHRDTGLSRLFERARRGDRETAALLLDRNRRIVLAAIRRRLRPPVRQVFDALDILQEVAIALLDQDFATVFASPGVFRAYVNRAARHKAIDANRRYLGRTKFEPRRVQSLETLPSSVKKELIDPAPPPVEHVMAESEWEQFVADLTELQATILLLRQEGNSVREIGSVLDVEEHVVRYRLELLKKRLVIWWGRSHSTNQRPDRGRKQSNE